MSKVVSNSRESFQLIRFGVVVTGNEVLGGALLSQSARFYCHCLLEADLLELLVEIWDLN